MRRLDDIVAEHASLDAPLNRGALLMHQYMARAFVAIAAEDWSEVEKACALAQEWTDAMRLGHAGVELMANRAFAQDCRGVDASALLREAKDLCATYGISLTALELHPALADWLRKRDTGGVVQPTPSVVPPHGEAENGRSVVSSTTLTPKQRTAQELVDRHLTNKEIALAMGVGGEMVKWHLKNLFAKLDATSRKQIVHRAQLMGLIQENAWISVRDGTSSRPAKVTKNGRTRKLLYQLN
jgi:LuxR family maltose regulon positive regulatory protein